ncbi:MULTISPECIES: hypothetical protein [Photorhabdus]|uniref:hypothetical protein n=1 Tax=Photorhabdus TaxID=29487 RepID=UPI0021D48B13|nr:MULTISPECIES: hypothetical protein [Photorhabdus]MCT8353513.1 hypothetical protein [Photorhabdus kayaii]MDB6369147.1 hypothetical protein [Photorhabdus bodei]
MNNVFVLKRICVMLQVRKITRHYIVSYGCYFYLLLAAAFLLTGCAQELTPKRVPTSSKIKVSSTAKTLVHSSLPHESGNGDCRFAGTMQPSTDSNSGKLAQCTRELEALKQFNGAKYTRYKAEFDRIARTGSQYLAVANGISQDINDLVRPKYQYALTSLCYRIKNDLSLALINQVDAQ